MTETKSTTKPARLCEVDGCERKHRGHGFCTLHLCRFRKTGTTELPRKNTREERFWLKVDRQGSVPEYRPDLGPCWLWTASLRAGRYGQFAARHGKILYAHRFSYELASGPIPDGLQIDHLCRVPRCVRPDHLEPVTNRENVLRGFSSGANAIRTGLCHRGHDEWSSYGTQGQRQYLACARLRARGYQAKKQAAQAASEAA